MNALTRRTLLAGAVAAALTRVDAGPINIIAGGRGTPPTSGGGGTPGILPNVLLTSAASSATYPWTIGHPFKQGDVPSGFTITADSLTFQADIRNRWSDGSVKFAVLSGTTTHAQNVAKTIALSTTSSAPGGSIAEPSPATLGSQISVTLTGVGAGTYTPQIAATNGITAWNRTTARKVREFLGPVMSEFHYYSPTSDGHLTIWWHVRVYADRTWVETIIEQGWTKVAGPTAKTYTANVVINGSSKFNSSVNHRHHARWSRQDWVGTDPQITPAHDRTYLGSTKLVPNYGPATISATMLNGYPSSAAPMTRGSFDADGTETGAHIFLGILPEWEAAYVISGDKRAFNAMLANEQASNCASYGVGPGGGNNGFVQRDEATGLPAAPNDFGNDSYDTGGGLVAGSGGIIWTTDPAHAWSAGYLAYLTTGRWFSLETCQHQAVTEYLTVGNYINGSLTRIADGHVQDRGAAWMWRTAGSVLAITPDSGSALRAKYIAYLQANVTKWRTNEVGFNNLGVRKNIFNRVDYGSDNSAGTFQLYFLTQSVAFAKDLAAHALSSTAQTQFAETVAFHCSMPVGMLGVRPGGFCYKQAANYGLVVGPAGASTFFADFGAWFDGAVAAGQLMGDNVCSLAGALSGGNFPEPTSYWGNFLPAISYAVDQGVAGAAAAYARMTSASNWLTFYNRIGEAPQWAVIPR